MRRSVFGLCALSLVLLLPSLGQSHGVMGSTESDSASMCASFSYDNGQAMSYSAVEIFAPGERKIPFQTGRADRNGYFCFRPDTPGRWRVVAQDEEGHILRLNAAVSEVAEKK
jgi:nickel transport protein